MRHILNSNSSFHIPALALLSAALMISIVIGSGATQGIDSDSAWQFKAVDQRINGYSSAFPILVTADPGNLSANKSDWITWWAPGNAMIVYSLMRMHLKLGLAVRIIAILCLAAGSVGWSLWFNLFSIPKWAKILISVSIPWCVYAHNALFYYGAEPLLFGTVPWALLLLMNSMEYKTRFSLAVDAAAGLSLGLLYVLKYSGIFISIGGLTYVGIQLVIGLKSSNGVHFERLRTASVYVLACMAPIIGLNLFNHEHAGAMNLVTASQSFGLRLETVLFAVANPPLAFASADSALRYVLYSPTIGLFPRGSDLWLGLAGLPGGVLLLILLLRSRPSHPPAILACCVFSVSLLCVMAVWTLSNGVSYDPRHVAGGSLAILPYVIETAHRQRLSRGVRTFLAACGVCYIVLPTLYGVFAVVGKTFRESRYRPGPSDIYDPFLSSDGAESRSILLQDFDQKSDVWYVMHPIMALDLPGRIFIRRADDIPIDNLRKESMRTEYPVRIRLVLPATPEMDEKAEVIKESFSEARKWTSCSADESIHCWTSWVDKSTSPNTSRPTMPPFVLLPAP